MRHTLAYKKVAKRTHPVPTTLPQYAKVRRHFHEDPLTTLPIISKHPPIFVPSEKLSDERMDAFKVFSNKFLWEEEKKLAAAVLKINEKGLAWEEADKG